MGIKGFTTFINDRAHLYFENYELHDCTLIIDGYSIAYQLYNWKYWRFDIRSYNSYGGDYDKYAYVVENFFGMLKEVKVNPIVIFDGGFEERKLPTILKRMQNKINTSDKLNPECEAKQPNKVVFPLFLTEAFNDILRSLDIKMYMCKYEADAEIANIAKLHNCPVLTWDSDYFLFKAQYIPFKTLDSKVRLIKNWRTGTYKCITCKIYKIEKFLEDFQGLQESSLHLLPVLIGNDYIDDKLFNNFLKTINLLSCNSQEKIEDVLNWLKNESTESAIKKILKSFKTAKERKCILKIIEKIMSGYHFAGSKLLKYLNIPNKNVSEYKNFDFTALKEEIHNEPENYNENININSENKNRDPVQDGDKSATNLENTKNNVKTGDGSDKIENGNIHLQLKPPDNRDKVEQMEGMDIDPSRIDSDSQIISNKNEECSESTEKQLENDGEDNSANNLEDEEIPSIYTFNIEESHLEKENSSENPISKQFFRNFTKCQYPSSFMDILTQNKYYCIPQIENHVQEHSHTFSLELVCAIHKILTRSAGSKLTVISRGEGSSVKWFPQDKCTIPVPSLKEIGQLSLQGRQETFLKILNIDGNCMLLLEHFPTEWHTFLLSLKFAASKTTFEPHLIHSLILCFIILNYVDEQIGFYRSPERYKKKYFTYIQNLPSVTKHIPFRTDKNCFSNFPSKDCIIFMQKVVHFFTLSPRESAINFDKNLVHSMAQIQSVLLHIKYLNCLLKCPYPNLVIHKIFDGTFIYNLTRIFRKKSTESQNDYLDLFFKDCPSILAGLKYVLNRLNK